MNAMRAIKVLCVIAAIAIGASYFDFGSLSPCILRDQVRHRDDWAAVPSDAVAGIVLLGQKPGLLSIALLPASQPTVQPPPQSTTSEDIFRAILREAQPAIDECSFRRLRGKLPTFAASAECSNRRLIAAFSAAHYEYMDLIQYLAAKRLEVSEQIDRKELTEEQARRESMKIIMQLITAMRERDSGAR